MCNRAETFAKMKNVGLCLSLSSSVLSKSTGLIRVYLGVFFFKFVIFHVYRVYRVYFHGVRIHVCTPTCQTSTVFVFINCNRPCPFVSIVSILGEFRVYRVYLVDFSFNILGFCSLLAVSMASIRVNRVYLGHLPRSIVSIVSICGTCLFFRVYRVYFTYFFMTFVSIRVYRVYFLQKCLFLPCLSYLFVQSGWDVLPKKIETIDTRVSIFVCNRAETFAKKIDTGSCLSLSSRGMTQKCIP